MNEEFGNVMKNWKLLEEEKNTIENFFKELKEITDKDPDAILDLSVTGDFREFGNYLADDDYRTAVVNVDILAYDKEEFTNASLEEQERFKKVLEEKGKAFQDAKSTAGRARNLPEFSKGKRKMRAEDFYDLLLQTDKDLRIRKDFYKLLEQVKKRWEEMGVDINFDGGVPGDFSILDKTDNYV